MRSLLARRLVGRRLWFATGALLALLAAGGATFALAQFGDPDPDGFNHSGTATATNSGNTTFAVGTFTVSCTHSTATFSIPASPSVATNLNGLVFDDDSGPPPSPCNTSTAGVTATTSVSTANGSWTLTFNDIGDTGTDQSSNTGDSGEPNSDSATIAIPKAGATITTSNGCTITVDPSAGSNVTASYNDAGTAKFSSQRVSVSATGTNCPSGTTGTFNGTYTVSPSLSDVS